MSRTSVMVLVVVTLLAPAAWSDDSDQDQAGEIPVVIKAFPISETTGELEPEVLDFRYRPSRWQTCIGLVDDPHKTIVGDDGGLYYEYGKRGPEAYSNGQGSFGSRVLAEFVGSAPAGPLRQSLLEPRVPIVVGRQRVGQWTIRQEAWSGVAPGKEINRNGEGRVDYLSIKASNGGQNTAEGKLVLHLGASRRLELDQSRTRVLIEGDEKRLFCQFSKPCNEPENLTESAAEEVVRIGSESAITVNRNWAQPTEPCAACFRDVLVGYTQPLSFQIKVPAGQKRRVALGFIEGWHAGPGKRPLRIEIEGKVVRKLDLVGEFGRNVPRVFTYDVADENRDGRLRIRILPVDDAEDRNTIISGLWVFPAESELEADAIVEGTLGEDLIARVDSAHLPDSPRPLRLTWGTGRVALGDSFDLAVALPLTTPPAEKLGLKSVGIHRWTCVDAWYSVDLPYNRFVVPDPAVQRLLDSCIRNIYQAREWKDGRPKFQVGPTCYRGAWAADGPFLLEAVSYLGRTSETRAGLEQQVDGDDGPGGVEFSKKSGLRLWMIWRHVQLAGDRQWLKKMWPRVEREVNEIVQYRKMTRDDPDQANFGLMPIGFGDGGLGGKHREYTNVYWTLSGLKAAIEMADATDHPVAETWRDEYRDYWNTFDRARDRDKLVDKAGNTYVPVTMKGEQAQLPQRGAWAFLQSIYPGRIFESEDVLMQGTMAMLDANQREGLIFGTGWIEDGIWNYAASFYAHAHLWLGHGRKAAATLYAFGNHASPMLCWREEQNPVGERPHFVGDMPHNWGSAEFIRLVRHLVILERGNTLHLFEGLPRAWTRPGGVLEMKDVPTSFGDTSVRMEMASDGRSAKITLHPPQRETGIELAIHLESFAKSIESVQLNDTPLELETAAVKVDGTSVFIVKFKK